LNTWDGAILNLLMARAILEDTPLDCRSKLGLLRR
jgi:hypothetical protein